MDWKVNTCINNAVFPNYFGAEARAKMAAASVARFWSSSSVGQGCFLYVGFSEGSAGEGERNSPGAVRLVRDGK